VTDEPRTREEIRRRAREMAVRMGHRAPEPAPDAETTSDPSTHTFLEPLPTTNPTALRQLMLRGRLTPGQVEAARRLFNAAGQFARDYPEDAA